MFAMSKCTNAPGRYSPLPRKPLLFLCLIFPLLLSSFLVSTSSASPFLWFGSSKKAAAKAEAEAAAQANAQKYTRRKARSPSPTAHHVCEICGTPADYDVSSCYVMSCSPTIETVRSAPFSPMEPAATSPPGTSYITSSILAADDTDVASTDALTSMLLQWVELYQRSGQTKPAVQILVSANVLASFKKRFNALPRHLYSISITPSSVLPLQVIPEKAEMRTLGLVFPGRPTVSIPIGILVKKSALRRATTAIRDLVKKHPVPPPRMSSATGEGVREEEDVEEEEEGEEDNAPRRAVRRKSRTPNPPLPPSLPSNAPPVDLAAVLALLQNANVRTSPVPPPLPSPTPLPASTDMAALLARLLPPASVPAPAPAPNPNPPPPSLAFSPEETEELQRIMLQNRKLKQILAELPPLPSPSPTLMTPSDPTPSPTIPMPTLQGKILALPLHTYIHTEEDEPSTEEATTVPPTPVATVTVTVTATPTSDPIPTSDHILTLDPSPTSDPAPTPQFTTDAPPTMMMKMAPKVIEKHSAPVDIFQEVPPPRRRKLTSIQYAQVSSRAPPISL